jgi:glycosyltransferase involved in cell wall biosynthesis
MITCDSVGCREAVVEGRKGYVVPPRDSKSRADAMLCFILQPELITAMSRENRKLAKERFDVHRIKQKIFKEMGVDHPEAADFGADHGTP